jgi:hypothetical protein
LKRFTSAGLTMAMTMAMTMALLAPAGTNAMAGPEAPLTVHVTGLRFF